MPARAEALDWPSLGPDDPLHRPKYRRALSRVRRFCLALPGGAEKISRGHMPIFTSGGKNFAMVARTDHRAVDLDRRRSRRAGGPRRGRAGTLLRAGVRR